MNSIVSLLVLGLVLYVGLMLMSPTSGVPHHRENVERRFKAQQAARQMPLSKNLTLHERLHFGDDCDSIGADCKLAEQCCTKVCLLVNMRCGVPIF
ncbi:uncharacterized protein LOC117187149 [Drosophila miranda]|uniref:uncharacterized protein LOC117187149 n=1 Tax=Drosophila miranda TaxID=7229 RepID=UPI00143FA6FE|nr:uncharacterized protein LOC117187149 [Drosophila miranda]